MNAPFSLIDEGVTNTSKHQAEAIQWLNYSTTGAGAAIFARYAKDLPAAKEPASVAVVGTATANLESFFQANSKGEPGTEQYIVHGAMAGKNTNPAIPSPSSRMACSNWSLAGGYGEPGRTNSGSHCRVQ